MANPQVFGAIGIIIILALIVMIIVLLIWRRRLKKIRENIPPEKDLEESMKKQKSLSQFSPLPTTLKLPEESHLPQLPPLPSRQIENPIQQAASERRLEEDEIKRLREEARRRESNLRRTDRGSGSDSESLQDEGSVERSDELQESTAPEDGRAKRNFKKDWPSFS